MMGRKTQTRIFGSINSSVILNKFLCTKALKTSQKATDGMEYTAIYRMWSFFSNCDNEFLILFILLEVCRVQNQLP